MLLIFLCPLFHFVADCVRILYSHTTSRINNNVCIYGIITPVYNLLKPKSYCGTQHREPEHFIGDEINCTNLFTCVLVSFLVV